MKLSKKSVLISSAIIALIGVGSATAIAIALNNKSDLKVMTVAVINPKKSGTSITPTPQVSNPEVNSTQKVMSENSVTPSEAVSTTNGNQNNNPYPKGSESWYVYDRRIESGKSMGLWGGYQICKAAARSVGLIVDATPEVGSIAIESNENNIVADTGIVDSIDGDSFSYSTMINGQVVSRTSDEANQRGYHSEFIH